MRKTLLFVFVVFGTFRISAQQYVLSGRVTDRQNNPVSFVSVYIKDSSYGTTANENGRYQFKLNPGVYNVVYRFVGYKQRVEKIIINNADQQNDIQLEEDLYRLTPSKVTGNDPEDPAMDIMRKVIIKRKYYLEEVKSYSCVVYIKGVKKILKSPKTLLAKGVVKALNLDTGDTGISYQSESISDFTFARRRKVKEVFVASKIAGLNPPFGYNKASDLAVNFYNNLFYVNGLSSHGFVSPVAKFAFKYYKYKLLGTIVENGKKIDKIQVSTKHGKALSFSGDIYILENDWRIYSVDLYLTNTFNNLNFVDTLRVSQQYIPIKDNIWMPLSFQYSYVGSVQGFKFSGYYLGIYNHYKIDTVFSPGYFTGEILHVDTEANRKPPAYWFNTTPVPLTPPEELDYHKNDSLRAIGDTKKYQDSLQHANNRLKVLPYITKGHLATYKNNKDSLFISPLLQSVYYNTVEGLGLMLKGIYSRTYDDHSSLSMSPQLRYGFADKVFSANIRTAYTYDQGHAGRFFLNFGSDILDLNNLGTRSLYFNTLSTLLSEQNFVKYYQSQFIDFGFQRELANGVLWMANLSYANRTQLYNNSYNHIFTYDKLKYTSNNPLAPLSAPADDHSLLFPQNQALIFSTAFRFTIDQEYMTRPTGKVYLPSRYPVLTVSYRKGINGILGSDVNYDFVSADISQEFVPLGYFGHSAFELKVGGFLNNQTVYYPDYNHFLGNEGTTSDPTYFRSFHFLPFYTFSTKAPFLEAHFQHNFAGAVFDNVPGLRRLKLEEIVGANYLGERNRQNYTELYFGIKRLIYGADYGVSYLGNKKYIQGFRIFIGLK